MTSFSGRRGVEGISYKIMACLACGKDQNIPQYRWASFKCCSRKCGHQHRLRFSMFEKNCVICDTGFSVIHHRKDTAKYCSNKCRYQGAKGCGSVEIDCHHCHKKFMASPSQNRKYCSKRCVNKASHQIWNPAFTTVRKAMERRGLVNQCQECGYDEEPRILGVHHMDHDRKNNLPGNLKVLCPNCHSLEHLKHTPHMGGKIKPLEMANAIEEILN